MFNSVRTLKENVEGVAIKWFVSYMHYIVMIICNWNSNFINLEAKTSTQKNIHSEGHSSYLMQYCNSSISHVTKKFNTLVFKLQVLKYKIKYFLIYSYNF